MATIELNETDLRRRRPVWAALSDLFLDTEVRPLVVTASAACLSSGYSDQEPQTIWRHEVSPVLAKNLLATPGGEWSGFDPDWLEAEILQRRPKVTDRLWARLNLKSWNEVCRLRTWLSTWPTSDRDHVVRSVEALTRSAYDETPAFPEDMPNVATEVLERIWKEGAAPLISALHIRGNEAPVKDFLERGRQALQRVLKER